ncbi:MAG: hypothetical protein AAB387_11430, partial [candidate division NC10 bacterium]
LTVLTWGASAGLLVLAALAYDLPDVNRAFRPTRAPSVVILAADGTELARMGACIETDGAIAVVRGVPSYQGAPVMASDLRASAALVLAGLAARGQTTVSRVYHLDRGYERLEAKLAALGARITRRQ